MQKKSDKKFSPRNWESFKHLQKFHVLKNSLSALVIVKVAPISSELELQLKNWVLELELEPLVLWELSQDRGSDSAFRKGLLVPNQQ